MFKCKRQHYLQLSDNISSCNCMQCIWQNRTCSTAVRTLRSLKCDPSRMFSSRSVSIAFCQSFSSRFIVASTAHLNFLSFSHSALCGKMIIISWESILYSRYIANFQHRQSSKYPTWIFLIFSSYASFSSSIARECNDLSFPICCFKFEILRRYSTVWPCITWKWFRWKGRFIMREYDY